LSRRITAQPVKLKKNATQIKSVEVPVKGLSLLNKTREGNPQTATILTNWAIKEDRLSIRPGRILVRDEYPTGTRYPIERLLPFPGPPRGLLPPPPLPLSDRAAAALPRLARGAARCHPSDAEKRLGWHRARLRVRRRRLAVDHVRRPVAGEAHDHGQRFCGGGGL